MSHRDWRDDRRDDRRSYIPHKRSADDYRSVNESDHKRSKPNNRDSMDVDHHSEKLHILPKHLQYWIDSDKDVLHSTENDEVDLGLGAEIRKLEFDLELAELEVEKWENQIQGIEDTVKEIDGF